MQKRSSTDVTKPSMLAVDSANEKSDSVQPEKNPAAVALGRLGGIKGGPARAAKLTTARRITIAKKAAAARWKQHNER